MRLKKLEIFVKLVEEENYSKVAEQLEISQPAVSMQINSLEEFFATELFKKSSGRLVLTPAGRAVYRNAKKILNSWQELKLEVAAKKDNQEEQLTIGASTIPAQYLMPDILAQIYQKRPNLRAKVKVGDSKKMLRALQQEKVDLITIGYKPELMDFKVEPFLKDELVLIMPQNSDLANKNNLKLNDLLKERLLIREVGSGTRKAMLASFKEAGYTVDDLDIVAEFGSTESIIAAVESGLGISFVSQLAATKAEQNRQISSLKLQDLSFERSFYLVYHPHQLKEEFFATTVAEIKDYSR